MKIVKLTKSMLKMAPGDLLVRLGLVNNEDTQAYPERLYLSEKDAKALKDNARKMFKKQFPGLSGAKLEHAVGMNWLNYGPNSSLEKALKPGMAVIGD